MLPALLYELLPYLYLAVGAVGCALFDSSLIIIASVLIIFAGFMVIWMRINYRYSVTKDTAVDVKIDKRCNQDRRQKHFAVFPLVDALGNLVEQNRRSGDRREMT